jgi:signal transduction histidine kinase
VDEQREPEAISCGFDEAAERFQKLLDTQREGLRDITHELRSPISRIRLFLERARQCPENMCDYLVRIDENLLRMDALTKKLLDFSRLEVLEETPVKEWCDLADLVFRVVDGVRIEAESRGCSIKHLTVAGCLVYANYELLHRAVENVVRNSVQYTEQNSSVVVTLSCPADGVAQVSVEDEGPGISDEELNRVFEPFYRAADTRALGTTGTGLGLSIAERAVALHRGTIEACNRSPRKGLRVTIQIPRLHTSQTTEGRLRPLPASAR